MLTNTRPQWREGTSSSRTRVPLLKGYAKSGAFAMASRTRDWGSRRAWRVS
jgi:hypothetical protein